MTTISSRAVPCWEIALRSKLQRPYVNEELKDIRDRTTKYRRLSSLYVFHPDCGHKYRVKKYGHKEEMILEGYESFGKCSICWRLSNTDAPIDLVEEYQRLVHENEPLEFLIEKVGRSACRDTKTPRGVLIEKAFYEWLYQ